MGKFHPRQALIGSEHRRPGHGHAGHHLNSSILQHFHSIQPILQANHQAAYSLIRSQDVGSCTKDNWFYVQFLGHFQDVSKFFRTVGKGHNLCRTANAEGGMFAEGFGKTELNLGQFLRCFFLKRVQFHNKRLRV